MTKLKSFAKLMNLVPLKDGPVKSEELLMYAKNLQNKARSRASDSAGQGPGTPNTTPPAGLATTPRAAEQRTPRAADAATAESGADNQRTTTILSVPPRLAGFGSSLL